MKSPKSIFSSLYYNSLLTLAEMGGKDYLSIKLLENIESGNIKTVKKLINIGVFKKQPYKRQQALYFAAQCNKEDIFKILMPTVITKNSYKYYIEKILYAAVQSGNKNIVETVLNKMSIQENDLVTHLYLSAQNNHTDVLKYLSAKVTDSKLLVPSLFQAIKNNNSDLVKYLLDRGISPEIRWHGHTLMTMAAISANIEILNALISAKANINSTDKFNCSPLMVCAYYNNYQAAELLIKMGADVNHQDQDGQYALFLATTMGNTKLAELLLHNNANPNLNTDNSFWYDGESALDQAVLCDRPDILKLFLKFGVYPNKNYGYKRPLLYLAASMGLKEITKILLENGVIQDEENFCQQSPREIALQNNNQEIVKILGGISSSKSVTKDCSKEVNNHVKNCLFSLRAPRLRILPTHKFTCSEIIEFRK